MSDPGSLIAVTGATGLVGKAFVRAALSEGYRLRLLRRRAGTTILPPGCEDVGYDLEDAALGPEALAGCAAVVHLAAHIPPSMADANQAERCFSLNALATLRLLEASEKAQVRVFVQAGAGNAYATGQNHPDEDAPQYPIQRGAYYLTSKLAQELFAAQWALTHDVRVACLRISSVYGPDKSKGALVRMATALLAGQAITLANAGQYGADFVHSDDVAAALVASFKTESVGAYNVGSGVRTTMAQIADLLVGLTGADPALVVVQEPAAAADPGFPALNIAKAKQAWGFDPVMIKTGLTTIVQTLKSGPTADSGPEPK